MTRAAAVVAAVWLSWQFRRACRWWAGEVASHNCLEDV